MTRTKWDGKPVAPDRWGRDHRSTLLYLETRVVDHAGHPDLRNLRRHDAEHPTRLANGTELDGHDDFDCIDDFEAAGLLVKLVNLGTGLKPLVELTDAGWQAAWKLRRERALAGQRKRQQETP